MSEAGTASAAQAPATGSEEPATIAAEAPSLPPAPLVEPDLAPSPTADPADPSSGSPVATPSRKKHSHHRTLRRHKHDVSTTSTVSVVSVVSGDGESSAAPAEASSSHVGSGSSSPAPADGTDAPRHRSRHHHRHRSSSALSGSDAVALAAASSAVATASSASATASPTPSSATPVAVAVAPPHSSLSILGPPEDLDTGVASERASSPPTQEGAETGTGSPAGSARDDASSDASAGAVEGSKVPRRLRAMYELWRGRQALSMTLQRSKAAKQQRLGSDLQGEGSAISEESPQKTPTFSRVRDVAPHVSADDLARELAEREPQTPVACPLTPSASVGSGSDDMLASPKRTLSARPQKKRDSALQMLRRGLTLRKASTIDWKAAAAEFEAEKVRSNSYTSPGPESESPESPHSPQSGHSSPPGSPVVSTADLAAHVPAPSEAVAAAPDTAAPAPAPAPVEPEKQPQAPQTPSKPAGEGEHMSRAELRDRHAREVLASEEVYVGKLKLVIDLYLRPLQAAARNAAQAAAAGASGAAGAAEAPAIPNTLAPPPVLSSQDINHIFSNLDIIVRYNDVLLDQLRKNRAGVESVTLGSIFMKLSDFLRTYIAYINNFPTATSVLRDLSLSNKKLDEFLKAQACDPRCAGLNLLSLLIMPVQRIPRYVLLLKEIIKYTEADDADLPNLEKALSKMLVVADDINSKKADQENLETMKKIEAQLVLGEFCSLLSVPHRRFAREGQLFEFTDRGVEICHYYLFTDVLCRATLTKSNKKKLRSVYPLSQSSVKPMALQGGMDGRQTISAGMGKRMRPRDSAGPLPSIGDPANNDASCAFLFSCSGEMHTLSALTSEETRQWLTKIEELIKLQLTRSKTFHRDEE